MSARELTRLIDGLDLNDRYYLRRTEDREERLRQFLRDTHPIMTPPNSTVSPQTQPPPTTTPQAPSQQQLMLLAHSNRLPNARFTGFIPVGVPNRIQYMSYDVARWLCDTETRCQVKGITDDVLKIKEAKMAVAQDIGDASIVLNTGRMNEITSFATFKEKCLKFWRSASERDRYHALSDFLSVEFSDSMGVFAGNLERARARVLQDLHDDSSFEKGNAAAWQQGSRSTEVLVSLDEVINYFSWGVLWKAVPPSHREALRKIDVNYDDDYIDILSKVQSELCKKEKGTNVELAAYASQRSEFTNSNTRKSTGSKPKQVKCFRCDTIGHFAKECKLQVKCSFCHKKNHVVSLCWKKQRQSKGRSGNASSSNVVDTEDNALPLGEDSS